MKPHNLKPQLPHTINSQLLGQPHLPNLLLRENLLNPMLLSPEILRMEVELAQAAQKMRQWVPGLPPKKQFQVVAVDIVEEVELS